MTEADLDPDEELDDDPLRWYGIVAFVLLVVGTFAATVWWVLNWVGDCSKDELGGVAGDSMRAGLCDGAGGAALLLIPAAWVLGLTLATLALVRWEGGLRGTVLLLLLCLTPAVLPAAAYAGLNRSGTECPDDKLAAYREWVDDGSEGTPPYRCRTF